MKHPQITLFIDRHHPRKFDPRKGECAVSIRVTFDRIRRYYPLKDTMLPEHFDKILSAQRLSPEDRKIQRYLMDELARAQRAADKLPVFTHEGFRQAYLVNLEASDLLGKWFAKLTESLRREGRIGTAMSYESAMKSLDTFRPGLRLADITVEFLKDYQRWMMSEEGGNCSRSTVGVYLRALRVVMNSAKIDVSIYPFGKGKFVIPTSRKSRKAVPMELIAKVYGYTGPDEKWRDLWFFLYLSNGMNTADMCRLKWSNIDGDILTYTRKKTQETEADEKPIIVALKPEQREIMIKWGVPSVDREAYIFPFLKKGLTAQEEKLLTMNVNDTINRGMKRVCKSLTVAPLTTKLARAAFATTLRNAGVATEMISEALGHEDVRTTKHYLESFADEALHRAADHLLAFKQAL